MAIQANKKRVAGPTLKEGDRVYLWRRNIKTKRQSSKLDFLKLGPFKIKRVKGPVNYELDLPKSMRIHPVFHISLLEKADPETPVDNDVELDPTSEDRIFEVEEILDHSWEKRQHLYLVKWKGYPPEENTWEPFANFQGWQDLIRYHTQHLGEPMPPGLHQKIQKKTRPRPQE